MATQPIGQSAFPFVFTIKAGGNDLAGAVTDHDQQHVITGMSLRDYFAAKAMQGLLSNSNVVIGNLAFTNASNEGISSHAYAIADAMLKAREA